MASLVSTNQHDTTTITSTRPESVSIHGIAANHALGPDIAIRLIMAPSAFYTTHPVSSFPFHLVLSFSFRLELSPVDLLTLSLAHLASFQSSCLTLKRLTRRSCRGTSWERSSRGLARLIPSRRWWLKVRLEARLQCGADNCRS